MKIKSNTPYELKYYIEGTQEEIPLQSEEFILLESIKNIGITKEEYDTRKDEIMVENILGDSIPVSQYVKNDWEKYKETIEEIKNQSKNNFMLTYVFPKKDYKSEKVYFESDDESLVAIKEQENFRGFAEIIEQTDEDHFFIGKKVDEDAVRKQVQHIVITEIDDKKTLVIHNNKEEILKELQDLVVIDSFEVSGDDEDAIKKFDTLAMVLPILSLYQLQSVMTTRNQQFYFDENHNIFLNTKLSDLSDEELDPDDYQKINGRWVKIGKLGKDADIPLSKTEEEIYKEELENRKTFGYDIEQIFGRLEEVASKPIDKDWDPVEWKINDLKRYKEYVKEKGTDFPKEWKFV